MGLINKPTTYSTGGTVSAANINALFDAIYDEFNGNIANANIASAAAIAWSKINKASSALNDLANVSAGSPSSGDSLVFNGSNWVPGSGVPQGGILMWSGTIENIPTGFVICDGNNSTPDLTDKFIIGVATADTNPAVGSGSQTMTPITSTPTGTDTIPESPSPPTDGAATSTHTHTVDMTNVKHFRLAFIMKT